MAIKSDLISDVFIKILDLPTVLVDLWMHMPVDSMGDRKLGLQENTRATECFLKASCVILMLQRYFRSLLYCIFASPPSVYIRLL